MPTDTVKIQNGYKIRGIEPPDLAAYDASTRKLYWQWVVDLGLKRKDKELGEGLDKDGKPLRPITKYTREHRRSAMTPSGKGDPSAPPLTPGFQKSRTRSLLNGRALSTHADFFWRYDSWTGDSWAMVLSYQAAHGRDVFGLSPAGIAWVKAQSWIRWQRFKEGSYRPAVGAARPTVAKAAAVPRIGRYDRTNAVEGMSLGERPEAGMGGFKARWTGGMTPSEWDAYFRGTATARVKGRPQNPKEESPIAGRGYNRIIRHTWGQGARPGGSSGTAAPVRPRPAPRKPVPIDLTAKRFTVPPPKPAVKPPELPAAGRVSAAFDLSNAPFESRLAEALRIVDGLHSTGDKKLPRIPIVREPKPHLRNGSFRHLPDRPVDITVSARGEWPELTLIHELGHYLDYFGMPKTAGHEGARTYSTGITKDWFKAVAKSAAVKSLRAIKDKRVAEAPDADGTTRRYKIDPKQVDYLLSYQEVWARSYAQWVASRSGDRTLIDQLNVARDPAKNPVYNNKQWTDEDFEPIGQAMDQLFASIGWRK